MANVCILVNDESDPSKDHFIRLNTDTIPDKIDHAGTRYYRTLKKSKGLWPLYQTKKTSLSPSGLA